MSKAPRCVGVYLIHVLQTNHPTHVIQTFPSGLATPLGEYHRSQNGPSVQCVCVYVCEDPCPDANQSPQKMKSESM